MDIKNKNILVNTLIIIVIAAGLCWIVSKFVYFGNSGYTDNAQIRQEHISLNSKVPGFVKEVRFDDFSRVRKGDTLIVIEDIEYRLALAQAQANLESVMSGKNIIGKGVETSKGNVAVSDAAIEEVKVNLSHAETNYNRYAALYQTGACTKLELDNAENAYRSLKARYETMKNQSRTANLNVSEQSSRLEQSNYGIAAAQAAVELARTNLSYTVITSPCDGWTSEKNIHVRELVQPGMELLSIVSSEEYWVIANYREKQLKNIQPGDKVTITVDAVGGVEYKGEVANIAPATGARYSLVPQNNATGNFVKVEQRVPVKIVFTKENAPEDMAKLRNGFNVECEIEN